MDFTVQQYLLNSKNLKSVFGTAVSFGAASLWVWPDRKSSVELDFPEEDGIVKDLTDPHFSARDFRLSCWKMANSRDELNAYYFGLFTELKAPGLHTLYNYDLDTTIYFYFKSQQNFRKSNRKLDGDYKVAVEFDLILSETDPDDNLPAYYLVDSSDRFLIA
jgi:hypothetical protein